MKAEDVQISHKIISSVAIALLGEVVPSLRAIAIDWNEHRIRTISYYDGVPTEDDFYLAEIIKSELREDFGEEWSITTEVARRDVPEKMEPLRSWAFYRKER